MDEREATAALARVACGDEAAPLEELYRAFAPAVLAFALARVGGREVAEEVGSRHVARVLALGDGAFRGDSRVLTWLLGIAKRQAYVRVRRTRLTECPLDEAAEALADAAGDAADSVPEAAGVAEILAALDALPVESAETVRLAWLHELPDAEIAAIADAPGGARRSPACPARGGCCKRLWGGDHERNGFANARSAAAAGKRVRTRRARIRVHRGAHLEAAPSPLEAERWPAAKGARLAASLVAAQVRRRSCTPCLRLRWWWLRLRWPVRAPIGMTGVAAVEAAWWFAAFLLVGAAITVTLALSSGRADALALATPLGPQTVVLARLAAVLGVDALVGLASSGRRPPGGVRSDWVLSWSRGWCPSRWLPGPRRSSPCGRETPWGGGAVVGAALGAAVCAARCTGRHGRRRLGTCRSRARGGLAPSGLVAFGAALLAAAVRSVTAGRARTAAGRMKEESDELAASPGARRPRRSAHCTASGASGSPCR